MFSEGVSSGTPQVLHVPGITTLISVNTRAAWDHAHEAALAIKEEDSALGRSCSQPLSSIGLWERFVAYG